MTTGANTWSVTGSGVGNLNSVFPFSAVESLVGGVEADQFVFATTGSVAGRIIGGTGVDTLNLSAKTVTHTVNLQTNTATFTGGIESIETIHGGSATAGLLIAPNAANAWQIDGANAGVLNGQAIFTGFENLAGGTASDTFVVAANGGVTKAINGGLGTDRIDLSAKGGAIEVRLGTTPAITGVAGAFSGIEQIQGNGAAGSKVVGSDTNTTWSVNSSGDIMVGSLVLQAIGGISAGAGRDTLTGPAVNSTWKALLSVRPNDSPPTGR